MDLDPGLTGLKWECEKCGGTPERQFSSAVGGGDLYIVEIAQARENEQQVHFLCNPCWGRTLLWSAQLGYDIHTHSPTVACDSNCLARQKGRKFQFESFSVIDRRRGFQLIKAIDGQPKVNASPAMFAWRLTKFHAGSYARQMYYESIADASEVARQVAFRVKLRWSGVPQQMLDCHQIVVEWFESSYEAPRGFIQMPAHGEKSIGLHALMIEGYDPETEIFSFWNSWGSAWGDRGYGKMSLDYVRRYYHETFVIRLARWGPSPAKRDQIRNVGENSKEIRRLWMVENPRFKHILRSKGHNVRAIYYYTLSPTSDVPVSCIELTTGFGLLMGWLFLRHLPGEIRYSEITELYVWPIYRRMHLGAWLESAAVEEAKIHGSSEIRLLMNEADCVVGPPRGAGREFAKACGYDLRWRITVAPRARMTAIKSI